MRIEERNDKPIRNQIKKRIGSSITKFWGALFATVATFATSIYVSWAVTHTQSGLSVIALVILMVLLTVGFAILTIVALILNNKEKDMKLRSMEESLKQGHSDYFARDDADKRDAVLSAKLWVQEFWAFVGLLSAGALGSFVWGVVNFAVAQHTVDKVFPLVLSVLCFAAVIVIVVQVNRAKRVYPFNKEKTIDNAEKLIKHYEFLLREAKAVDETK